LISSCGRRDCVWKMVTEMIAQLCTWRRFILFCTGNVLVAILLYALTLQPALDYLQEQRSSIEERKFALSRAAALVKRRDLILQMRRDADQLMITPFVQGESPGLRSAELLGKLRQLAEGHNMAFGSVTTLPAREWEGFEFVGARIEVTALSSDMAAMLSSIEGGWPFLFIHSVKLARQTAPETADDRVAAALEIYGATAWRK